MGLAPGGREYFPLCRGVQTESEARMTLYPMDSKGFYPRLIGPGCENGHSLASISLGLREKFTFFWKDDKMMFLQQTVTP